MPMCPTPSACCHQALHLDCQMLRVIHSKFLESLTPGQGTVISYCSNLLTFKNRLEFDETVSDQAREQWE